MSIELRVLATSSCSNTTRTYLQLFTLQSITNPICIGVWLVNVGTVKDTKRDRRNQTFTHVRLVVGTIQNLDAIVGISSLEFYRSLGSPANSFLRALQVLNCHHANLLRYKHIPKQTQLFLHPSASPKLRKKYR